MFPICLKFPLRRPLVVRGWAHAPRCAVVRFPVHVVELHIGNEPEVKQLALIIDFLECAWLPRAADTIAEKGSEVINWDMDEDRNELFPIMRTDITVEKSDKKTIIDTKFYKDIFSYNYEKPKFHSNNLYQIYAYIKNYKNEKNKTVEGILLYPTTKQDIDSNHTIGGHNFRLMTVNLNQEWRNIERDLISIID